MQFSFFSDMEKLNTLNLLILIPLSYSNNKALYCLD